MKSVRRVNVHPIANIEPFLSEGELVAFNIGYDGRLYFVFALLPLDLYREAGLGIFPKTQPKQNQKYRVIALQDDRIVLNTLVENEPFNIYEVAPLPEGLLLACSRSVYRSAEDFEKNGRIYSLDGSFQRDLLLGDGIANLQTTTGGTIWTSYFDEGVFGNFGWDNPVGASGLVAWNNDGEKIYEFAPTGKLDSICDCYAMNVMGEEETWCYYYTDFPLVQIKEKKIVASWEVPVAGADAFAIENDYALFRGDYDKRDVYTLFQLEKDSAIERKQFEIIGESARPITAERVVGRRDSIYILQGANVYRLSIRIAVG